MPTSGVTDWALSAGEVIRAAMVELGALNSSEDPESSEETDAMQRLNAMLKTWGGEANLFREGTGTLTIAAATGAGTLPSSVRTVNSVRHILSATNQRPLMQWNRDQYFQLPNRISVGNPSIYYVARTPSSTVIQVWPVPAAATTYHLDYGQAVETVTGVDEELDVPQEWQEAVILGLASRCASMFGTTRLDPGTVQRVDMRAAELYQQLLDRDRPDSYFFEPWDGCYG